MATRHPAVAPVEVGTSSSNPIIYKVLYIPGGWPWDFSEPPTVAPGKWIVGIIESTEAAKT